MAFSSGASNQRSHKARGLRLTRPTPAPRYRNNFRHCAVDQGNLHIRQLGVTQSCILRRIRTRLPTCRSVACGDLLTVETFTCSSCQRHPWFQGPSCYAYSCLCCNFARKPNRSPCGPVTIPRVSGATRDQKGMTQEKLGQALGLTFQQVQKYEKGTNRIGASRLRHIASIQQVPISFFFEDAPGTIIYPRRALRLRLRLPRHVGRARADESLHADRKRQAQAIHCCFGQADRRRRRT
jgi:transcriptional regulator with XRE-family HTH domain